MKNISNSPQGGCPRREERLRIVQAPVPLLPDPHLVKRPVDEIWVMRSQGPSDLRKNGVALIDTHTGFKFIGDKICEFEETGSHTFPALRLLPSGAVCMPRLSRRKSRIGTVRSRRLRRYTGRLPQSV